MIKRNLFLSFSLFVLLAASACGSNEPLTPTATASPEPTQTTIPTVTPTGTPTETPTLSLPVFSDPELFSIAMFTPLKGWAVANDNNRLLVTVDGGLTWYDATPPGLYPLPPEILSLSLSPFSLDETTAFVTPFSTESGAMYKTLDGGQTWETLPLPFERARYHFLTGEVGFALVDLGAGAGSHYVALYRTSDGGGNWTEVFSHEPGEIKSLPNSGTKNGVTFLDVTTGWIGGSIPMTDYFHFYATIDGGATWSQETDITLPVLFTGSFLDVQLPFFLDENTGYLPVQALTDASEIFLLIYRSDDSGQTWNYQNHIQDGRVVDFYSLDAGWIAAGDSLLHTTDGGATWTANTLSGIGTGEIFLDVDFVDDQHGWVITTPNPDTWSPRKLYRTTDGGSNWVQLLP